MYPQSLTFLKQILVYLLGNLDAFLTCVEMLTPIFSPQLMRAIFLGLTKTLFSFNKTIMNKTLTFSCLLVLLCTSGIFAQNVQQAQLTQARLLGISKPLREISSNAAHTNKLTNKAKGKAQKPSVPNFIQNTPMRQDFATTAQPQGPDPLAQNGNRSSSAVQVVPQLVFDGISENDAAIYPPDPSGYIGSNHYIQSTNHPSGTVF